MKVGNSSDQKNSESLESLGHWVIIRRKGQKIKNHSSLSRRFESSSLIYNLRSKFLIVHHEKNFPITDISTIEIPPNSISTKLPFREIPQSNFFRSLQEIDRRRIDERKSWNCLDVDTIRWANFHGWKIEDLSGTQHAERNGAY